MLRCKSSRETLVLSLVLLKDLKVRISNWGAYYGMSTVEFQSCGEETADMQSLCHELNHALHDFLGIEGFATRIDTHVSGLEQGLFQFLPKYTKELGIIQLPLMLEGALWGKGYCSDMIGSVEMSLQQFYRMTQLSLLWDNLEELWNMIGFAKIGNCIYINRMSDLNYVKIPALFHKTSGKFTDFWESNRNNPDIDLSAYPFIGEFLAKMDEMVKNISVLCPTPEAWAAWLKLHGRKDTDVGYITIVDKSLDELRELAKKMELIEDPLYATVAETH